MSRHRPSDWSQPWSLDRPRSRRIRLPRSPLIGMALAGAIALTPLPLAGAREATILQAEVATAGRPDAPAGPARASRRPVERSPQLVPPAPPGPADPASLTGYVWPLPRGRLTQSFGITDEASRTVGGKPFHDGIDLATFCGDRIVAAHAGRVLAAGRRFDGVIGYVGDLGRYYERVERKKLWLSLPIVVVIDDGNGYRSMYAHLSKAAVKRGQVVRAGQLLGYEGATGNASGCHLHYGLFSPLETELVAIRPDLVRRWKLPRHEIARIDPLLVLPDRPRKGQRPIAKPVAPLPVRRSVTAVPS